MRNWRSVLIVSLYGPAVLCSMMPPRDPACSADAYAAAWSPDGQRIAFATSAFDEELDVCVMDTDGNNVRPLANDTRLKRGRPLWSPDGSRIAVKAIDIGGGTGNALVSIYAADFPDLPSIDIPSRLMFARDWSPAGRYIAFEHCGNDMWPTQIRVMDADGSGAHRLTGEHGMQYAESDSAWSPAGALLAFWSYGYGIARRKPTAEPTRRGSAGTSHSS